MKSVGEAMSLGRNFIEALGKVMRSLETSRAGFWTTPDPPGSADETLRRLASPSENRLYDIELALRLGATIEQVSQASGVDPWFVAQIAQLVELRSELVDAAVLDAGLLRRCKHSGLSDRQIAALRPELAGENGVRSLRSRLGIHPVYKTVDTCAAEFEAKTPYHYSSYELDPPPKPKWPRKPKNPKCSSSVPGLTGSVRASNSTTAACTRQRR
ncbi:carbamoyl-phosphate synthetase large chain, oligomerization domain protein [Mycobacterium xenopi 4042]|uniref:Carbamoyl-phosphate synthetase large chain, oligomerization domain protein n=1 Tax=Mycobacterium xenopi 4042 TaxID=1299334 RepID=X7YRN6_MYCXE|nr:carbamoyl-phosphate synthetase large chain, oligomerization domain protein [Mycobacterium xenopi 4042]